MTTAMTAAVLILGIAINCGLAVAIMIRVRGSRTLADEVRNDLRLGREESRAAAKEVRDDLSLATRTLSEMLRDQATLQQTHFAGMIDRQQDFIETTRTAIEGLRTSLEAQGSSLQTSNESKLESFRAALESVRETIDKRLEGLKEQLSAGLQANTESCIQTLDRAINTQIAQLEAMTKHLKELSETNNNSLDRIRTTFDARFQAVQAANDKKFDEMRCGVSECLKICTDTLEKSVHAQSVLQQSQLETMQRLFRELSQANQDGLDLPPKSWTRC
jgi:DNA anti-recombination protein RmuC